MHSITPPEPKLNFDSFFPPLFVFVFSLFFQNFTPLRSVKFQKKSEGKHLYYLNKTYYMLIAPKFERCKLFIFNYLQRFFF